jgi:trimeric autotransporter adhesin
MKLRTTESSARLALLLALAPLAAAQNWPQFPEMLVAGSDEAVDLVLQDLDGDGHLDLAWVQNFGMQDEAGLWIARGDGTGALAAAAHFPAHEQPERVAFGDLDGDGVTDALLSNVVSDDVSVLLGDGAGGFSAPTHLAAGDAPSDVELSDLDGDGALDVVVTCRLDQSVLPLLGDGAGGLLPGQPVASIFSPTDVALLDMDQDGDPDAVVSETQGWALTLYEGDGAGALQAPVVLSTQVQPGEILVADLREDGLPDFVVTSFFIGVQVCLADGAGGVTLAGVYHTGANLGYQPALGDVLEDGHLDLLVPQMSNPERVLVFSGDGTGDFTEHGSLTEVGGQRLALGDLDEDGTLDLAASRVFYQGVDKVGVTRGDPAGLFLLPVPPLADSGGAVAPGFADAELVDVDSDGFPDLLVAMTGDVDGLYLAHNLGDGRLVQSLQWAEPDALASVTGLGVIDMNLDGTLDAALGVSTTSRLRVVLAAPGGSWVLKDTESTGKWPEAVGVGHLDDDGLPDVVVANTQDGTLQLHFGEGGGRVGPGVLLPMPGPVGDVTVGDATGDGVHDIVAGTYLDAPQLVVLPGDGSGGFPTSIEIATSGWVTRVKVADLDGDGVPGVLAAIGPQGGAGSGVWAVEGNGGSGLVGAGAPIPLTDPSSDVDVGDLGGDGRPDLVVVQNDFSIFDQDENGAFPLRRSFDAPGSVLGFAADANGDGARDLVAGGYGNATVLINADGPLAVLGDGLAGELGAPALAVLSDLGAGAPLSLRVQRAAPLAPVALVVGLSLAAAPLKGGVLVPDTDLLVALATDTAGELQIDTTWPAGLPPGFQVWLQAWIHDTSAPHDVAATRGLQVTTP